MAVMDGVQKKHHFLYFVGKGIAFISIYQIYCKKYDYPQEPPPSLDVTTYHYSDLTKMAW